MADMIDASEVERLATDMGAAAGKVPVEVAKVAGRGALNIKKSWQAAWAGLGHAPALPYAVNYDVTTKAAVVEAEIGPDKGRRQGPLGNLLEFGSINNPPRPGGAPALDKEAPSFVAWLEKLAEDGTGV